MQAIRRLRPAFPISQALERIAYWRANSASIEAAYYLYVLNAIETVAGSALSLQAYDEALADCRRKAKARRNRSNSFEWLGAGTGLDQLVNHSELGGWNSELDFWTNSDSLRRVRGRVAKIAGPEAGTIEVEGGLSAFFVPGRSEVVSNRDENQLVEFFLGFSYDGPRAWGVRVVSAAAR